MAEKNNLPTVDSAKIQLEGNRFRIIAKGSDKDGDPVTLSYEWEINGKSAGAGDTISGFKRGDKLAVKITPYDGKEYGMAKILTTEIRNTPPTIVEHREVKFDGKVWSYQVKATDADGDPLTYSLKSAPQGMTIDAKSGLIKWEVPPEFVGKASVTVSVTDGQGGESTYTFDAIISVEPKK